MKVSIVLAEDHAFTLHGMQQALDADGRFDILASASTGIEAIAQCRTHQPDVAVLDHDMPKANGLEALIEIARWAPQTRVVMLTGHRDGALLATLLHHGAHGILLKSDDVAATCAAIAEVARGAQVIAPGAAELIAGAALAMQITARELEVLHGIAAGLTNAGIAERLGVSPRTVDSHRTSLMRKLQVNSTAALMVRAVRDGLIRL